MIKRTVSDLKPYDAPGHYNMVAMRYHGKEETGAEKFWIGKSTFLPGGGAEWAYDDNPLEKVYFVLKGEMTVTDKDGKEYVIHRRTKAEGWKTERTKWRRCLSSSITQRKTC